MESPPDSEQPSELSERSEERPPVWPPRIEDPPRLPFAEDQYMGLALDPLGKAPEAPDFTLTNLTPRPKGPQGPPDRPDATPAAVIYDRRNPSGRTRGDRVLRPTEKDRIERLWRKRRGAALMAAFGAALVALILASLSPFHLAAVVVVAALAGWAAYDLGDSEVTWAVSMSAVGIPLGWSYDLGGILISLFFMAGAGWFMGFVRDADLT